MGTRELQPRTLWLGPGIDHTASDADWSVWVANLLVAADLEAGPESVK